MFAHFTSSLRYTLPRVELRASDRRSGAYPTKARTGDRTRSGRNNVYFDDTRSVIFQSASLINLPTTFRSGSLHLVDDLKTDFFVTGNPSQKALDQWITHREQVEGLGPFVENKLFEQGQRTILNSSFMTGAAHGIAPDRFKLGLSDKTIVRISKPLTVKTTLHASRSAIHYLNDTSMTFDQIATATDASGSWGSNTSYREYVPFTWDNVIFTPYGYQYAPINADPGYASSYRPDAINGYVVPQQDFLRHMNTYTADGGEPWIVNPGVSPAIASLILLSHAATSAQQITLSPYLASPFLIEKVVVELPIEAGPGWLNDSFNTRNMGSGHTLFNGPFWDKGGPLVTVALLRQTNDLSKKRDLIASATFTNAYEASLESWMQNSISDYDGSGTPSVQKEYVRTPLTADTIGFVVTGSQSPTGTNNFFSGTVKLVMNPAVTGHVLRVRASGSYMYAKALQENIRLPAQALACAFGSIGRQPGNLNSARSMLGGHLAFVPLSKLNGSTTPIATHGTQFENLVPQVGKEYRAKLNYDLATTTVESPYLLFPGDRLILCINKCKPGLTGSFHDIKIGLGELKITLYGDLVREDKEFHDTLNQRLETPELWENVGEEPVLDQFDVTYTSELSGSYLDRFNVLNKLSYPTDLTASNGTTQYYSNFTTNTGNNVWATSQKNWAKARRIYELQKSCRNAVLTSDEGIFWDCRLLVPDDIINLTTPFFSLGFWSVANPGLIVSPPGNNYYGGAVQGWWMSYPYEPKFNTLTTTLDKLTGAAYASNGILKRYWNYSDLAVYSGGGIGCNNYTAGVMTGLGSLSEFIKYFFGIGDGHGPYDNQAVLGRVRNGTVASSDPVWNGAELRGWRYGMLNGFPTKPICVFRRDHFGQFRDMLEQRLDAKLHDGVSVKESPVQVRFYDQKGRPTVSSRTLSSNLSTEATSSMPYTDGLASNRSTIDYSNVNISTVII